MAQRRSTLEPDRAGPGEIDDIFDRLDRLCEARDSVEFGRIVSTLGARGYAPLLLGLSAILVLPIGMVPGVGGAVGFVMALIGLQVMRGKSGLWVPGILRTRRIPARRLQRWIESLRPLSRWLGRRLSPRLTPLAEGHASLTGISAILIVAGLSMSALGFIPIIAPLIGLPMLFFALGVVSRDGRAVLAGYLLMLPPVVAAILWPFAGP